jgi:hypothetical protein
VSWDVGVSPVAAVISASVSARQASPPNGYAGAVLDAPPAEVLAVAAAPDGTDAPGVAEDEPEQAPSTTASVTVTTMPLTPGLWTDR